MGDLFRARRINVVGTSSVGKTTMAAALASLLSVPHVELDALHWEPNWTEAPDDVLRDRVRAAIAGEAEVPPLHEHVTLLRVLEAIYKSAAEGKDVTL